MYPFSMRDINSFSTAIQLAIVGKVLIAAVLASMIGWERDRAGKAAGTRTMALVGISATAVVAIGEALNSQFNLGDPTRALHAVVTGIGFLGAGLIFTSGKSNEIQGVTTSATVFTTAWSLGDSRSNVRPSRTASMKASEMLMPWCRFRDLRLKSPEGLRISRNSSISG